MRKIVLQLSTFLLCGMLALAQQKTVTGKVTDEKGNPIPFATIKIKNSTKGVSANAEGAFSIDAENSGSIVLVISSHGFDSQEIKSTGSGIVAVTLKAGGQLSEVVVTALGISRKKNTLPYAAQQINGEEISRVRTGNAASALSGKVSGLQIIQGNGIGGSTNVVVRGIKSLTGNNQALFVVDGVPVDNSNTNSANQTTGRGGYDYGNAAADINPDDIESINVLKGAASTALYGSRAANGVIMITTKKARRGLGITVNSGVRMGKID
ncbi:MAG: TonB-dependent receptor plug domain-containing protein, partial [Bacteroidota bacterium]